MLRTIVLIVIILCGIWGMTAVKGIRLLKSLIFYTQLSNLAAILSAVCALLFPGQEWTAVFRYLAVCMLIMTCLVTVFVLVPTIRDTQLLLWSRSGFFLHLVCPLLNILSYCFLEAHAPSGYAFLPPLVTLLYGIVMLYLNYRRIYDGPYPFLRVHNQSVTATVLWIIVLLLAMGSISSMVNLLCR